MTNRRTWRLEPKAIVEAGDGQPASTGTSVRFRPADGRGTSTGHVLRHWRAPAIPFTIGLERKEGQMRRTIRRLGLLGVIAGATWIDSASRRAREHGLPLREVMSSDFRGFVTHRFNPLVMRLGLAGGRRSPWAVVEHVGRTSGKTYRTPILPMTAADYAFIPLTYGSNVHWVNNVRKSGHCRIQLHETILELDEPAIVGVSDNPTVPSPLRGRLQRSGRQYLRLHILERVPGTFDRDGAAPGVLPAEPTLPPAGVPPEPATA